METSQTPPEEKPVAATPEQLTSTMHEQDRLFCPAAVLFFCGLFAGLWVLQMVNPLVPKEKAIVHLLCSLMPFAVFAPLAGLIGLLPVSRKLGWRETLGIRSELTLQGHIWANLKMLLILLPASLVLNYISKLLFEQFHLKMSPQAVEEFGQGASGSSYWVVSFVCAVVVSPLAEELLFRQILYRSVRHFMPLWATFLTSLLFALSHGMGQFYAGLFVLSLGFQYARNHGGIVRSILLHAMYNTISMLFLLQSITPSGGTP
ncbi:MAG: CPBP family intramembrane metalloprotease [Victivallales bacterium]|nr:CPBP family intramembrane metalloprotease [Victivallales bacterium]